MEFTALNSPAKPRTVTKYDPTNGNRTVSGTSGIIPRRSTTLYEKTSSTEKTNVIPAETKYVRVELVLLAAYHDSTSLDLKLMFEISPVIVCITIPVWQAYLVNVQSVGRLLDSGSNFKRQNTIDSATIKENTARLAAQSQRPASATQKMLTTADTSKG